MFKGTVRFGQNLLALYHSSHISFRIDFDEVFSFTGLNLLELY